MFGPRPTLPPCVSCGTTTANLKSKVCHACQTRPGYQSPSPEARSYGLEVARKLLQGRTGHGGGRCTARHLSEAELAALVAIAFQAGRNSVQETKS